MAERHVVTIFIQAMCYDEVMMTTVLACQQLYKTYRQGPQVLAVLRGVNVAIAAGEQVAIVGTSGAGKSTLFNLLGGLDQATAGEVLIAGSATTQLNDDKLSQLRNQHLGFVYQFHHLLAEFTALENVAMPLLIRGTPLKTTRQQAQISLEQVGLAHRLHHRPSELSGGERQRVAIARALVGKPRCVLLDEPTGNLDRRTAATVHHLLQELNQQLGMSLVIVTHDEQLTKTMDRVLLLSDGQLNPANTVAY